MSAHTMSMRDALYEAPGPRTKRLTLMGTIISLVLVCIGLALVVRQFYVTGQLDAKYWAFFTRTSTWLYLLNGFVGTIMVAATAAVISLVLGVVLMLGRTSGIGPLAVVCRVIIDFFRGVPSLLLIYFFYLGLPTVGIRMSPFWMIAIPVALAASGVLAEVFRAGVNAVPKGQTEAALSIGLTPGKTMFKIILPQALRIVIPSLISQLVVVVKDTTVAYVVSYPDLMQNARVLITTNDAVVSVYLVVAVIYILVNFAINQLSINMARRSGNPIISRTNENPT
ncbi:MAG: amino acid ABC transporter permease [Coriobacteriales bacterium]|nr:amino acid ABC transporter permease [Coriobacteriales bacterium]